MKLIVLLLPFLAACGMPAVPPPSCTMPVGAGDEYPLAMMFDGSKGLVVHSAATVVGSTARARVRNAAGNDTTNITDLYAFVASCNGAYLGTVEALNVGAGEHPGEWQTLEAQLDLSPFPDAAQLVLAVRPFYVQGQHLVDVDDFEVVP